MSDTPAPRPRLDLRLLPAAAAAWPSAALAVRGDTRQLLATLGALLGLLALTTWRGRRRAHAAHRTRWPGATAPLALALVAAAAVVIGVLAQAPQRYPPALAAALDTGTTTATVRLTGTPRPVTASPDGTARVVIDAGLQRLRTPDGQQVRVSVPAAVLAPASWSTLVPGTRVEAQVRLRQGTPGERAAVVVIALGSPDVVGDPPPWQRLAAEIRASLRAATAPLPAHARGLLPGIAVGADDAVPADLAEAMRACGLGHLLAVSGAHVAIVLTLVLTILAAAPVAVRLGAGALVLAGLVVLVGTEPSVVRAAVMGIVLLLALALGRRGRALSALAASVVVLLVIDPWLAGSIGFALSVAATAGIVLLSPPLATWLAARLERPGVSQLAPLLAPALAVPLAAQLACLPVLLLVEPGLLTYAVPANALVAPVVAPVTVIALGAALLAPVWESGATALLWLATPGTWWIDQVAQRAASAPLSRLLWPPGLPGLLLAGLLTFGLLAARHTRWPPRLLVVALAAVVTVTVLQEPRQLRPGPDGVDPAWRLVVCDVGQGSAALVSTEPAGGGGGAVMLDVGPPDSGIGRCLSSAGVEVVELLVLSHGDLDHLGGVSEVLASAEVRRAVLPAVDDPRLAEAAKVLRAAGVAVQTADTTTPPVAVGPLTLTMLWPTPRAVALRAHDPPAEAGNGLSLTAWVDAPGLSVLAPGDLGAASQTGLLRALREGTTAMVPTTENPTPASPATAQRPTVLLVPHHGSPDQSPEFLQEVAGVLAIVSVGRDNDYGHPAPTVLQQLLVAGSTVLRTDTCGAVSVRPVDDRLAVTRCP